MRKILIIGLAICLMFEANTFLKVNAISLFSDEYSKSSINAVANNSNNSNLSIEFVKKLITMINGLDKSGDVNGVKFKIASIVTELSESYNSSSVNKIAIDVLEILNKNFGSVSELLTSVGGTLKNTLANLLHSNEVNGLSYDQIVTIEASTAAKEQGLKDAISLNGYIYYVEGNKSTKWVVLVHPFMTNGTLIAQTLAETYLNMGYNVLAPDLRGFGKSEGSVAMGWLESLDIWDWLGYINDSTNVYIGSRAATDVIIHGVSLGGATTLQTWTQVGFGRDLSDMDVIGIIDDCGYSSMNGIIQSMIKNNSLSELLNKIIKIDNKNNTYDLTSDRNIQDLLQDVVKVGINDADWNLKSNALASGRIKSDVPIMVIHGTSDTMVDYSISKNIVAPYAQSSNLLYEFWSVNNQPHAFIIVGMKKTEYNSKVNNFVKYAEARKTNTNIDDNKINNNEKEENTSFIGKIGNAFSNFFSSIGNFFKRIFR